MSQLSVQEMQTFTDAKTHERQIAVLRKNRIAFAVSAKGRPVTTWEAINQSLCSSSPDAKTGGQGFDLQAARG